MNEADYWPLKFGIDGNNDIFDHHPLQRMVNFASNNKEAKFLIPFFGPFIFLVRIPLTKREWRVSSVRAYIYNS
jgi:hypothetical protein